MAAWTASLSAISSNTSRFSAALWADSNSSNRSSTSRWSASSISMALMGRAPFRSDHPPARQRLPGEDHDAGPQQRHQKAGEEAVVRRAVAEQGAGHDPADHSADHTDDDVGQAALTRIRPHDLA